MVEHRNIIDAERHEVKGASTASDGQVLKSNGDGSTSFVAPNTLSNIGILSTLEAQSTADQNPSGTDSPIQVSFGSAINNADVDVASDGTITILSSGLYFVRFSLAFGRSTNTNTAILISRLLINDIPTGFSQVAQVDAAADITPLNATILRSFSPNDTIKVEFYRDSGGSDNGGLRSVVPSVVGWSAPPSAAVRVQRIAGGS